MNAMMFAGLLSGKRVHANPARQHYFLLQKSVSELYQRYVLRLLVKKIVIKTFAKRSIQVVGYIRRAALGPNEVKLRSGAVFPAQNKIGTELHEVEVGIPKAVVGTPIAVFIHFVTVVHIA